MKRAIFALTCAIVVAGAACERSTTTDIEPGVRGTSGEIAPQPASSNLQNFAERAAIANMAEIRFGELAKTHAQSADVKQFGEMMARDHENALTDLRQAASAEHIQIPRDLDDEYSDLYQRLSGLSGPEFDREYMKAMVDGHEDVEDMLDRRGHIRRNDRVGEWAATTLPHVQEHLSRAKQIQDNLDRPGKR
jgi:putative membrane protein